MIAPSDPPILVIGTSDGIGRAVVEALIAQGRDVIGVSRSASPISSEAWLPEGFAGESVREGSRTPGSDDRPLGDERHDPERTVVVGPGRHRHLVIDVTSERFPAAIEGILTEHPDLRTVIHCAGVGSGFDPDDLAGELRCFRTNLMSVVELCARLVPHWRRKRAVEAGFPGAFSGSRGPHLVVLSSIADSFVVAEAPSYGASKIALSRYLRALGLRLRAEGIAISNIRFGFVDTKMAQSSVKPFLMTRERAARVVLEVLRTRVPVRTRPRRAALLAMVLEGIQRATLLGGSLLRRA